MKDISPAQSSGFDRLDRSAIGVVRHWRFVAPTQRRARLERIGIPAALRLAAA